MYYDEKLPRASRSEKTGEQTIPMGLFKAKCTSIVQEVAKTGEPVTLTKRGRAVVRIMPAVTRVGNTFIGSAKETVIFPHGIDTVEEGNISKWINPSAYEEEANMKFAPPSEPLLLGSGDVRGPRGGRRKGIRVGR